MVYISQEGSRVVTRAMAESGSALKCCLLHPQDPTLPKFSRPAATIISPAREFSTRTPSTEQPRGRVGALGRGRGEGGGSAGCRCHHGHHVAAAAISWLRKSPGAWQQRMLLARAL